MTTSRLLTSGIKPTTFWPVGFSTSAQKEAEQTTQEVRKEVMALLKEKERLESSLPSLIVIGPFAVSVEAVRQALSKKRKEMANGLLDHLAARLRKRVDRVRHSEWVQGEL